MATTTSTTLTSPSTTVGGCSSGKKSGMAKFIFFICFVFVAIVIYKVIAAETRHTIDFPWAQSSLAKPPALNCAGWVELDANHAEDHSKDSMDKPVYVNPGPGSQQNLCWSSWVTWPLYKSWDVKFTDPNAARDGCIAWLEYEGIDRVYGPFRGTQTVGLSNMPARFRIATNCQIVSYVT